MTHEVRAIPHAGEGGELGRAQVPTPLGMSAALAHGPDGDPSVYFVEFVGNKPGHIDVSTGPITEFPLPELLDSPFGFSTGANGSMWLTEFGGNRFARFDVHTHAFTEYPLPTPLSAPIGRLVEG